MELNLFSIEEAEALAKNYLNELQNEYPLFKWTIDTFYLYGYNPKYYGFNIICENKIFFIPDMGADGTILWWVYIGFEDTDDNLYSSREENIVDAMKEALKAFTIRFNELNSCMNMIKNNE